MAAAAGETVAICPRSCPFASDQSSTTIAVAILVRLPIWSFLSDAEPASTWPESLSIVM